MTKILGLIFLSMLFTGCSQLVDKEKINKLAENFCKCKESSVLRIIYIDTGSYVECMNGLDTKIYDHEYIADCK